MKRLRPVSDRFWSKVERTETCWLWTGSVRPSGYGQMSAGRRGDPPLKAHRVAYALTYGSIPEGRMVCHHCDVRLCVRPDHLYLGDVRDNARDMMKRGRSLAGERATRPKLTDACVIEIRRVFAAGGITQRQLAVQYGVHPSIISEVISRKRWSHVP